MRCVARVVLNFLIPNSTTQNILIELEIELARPPSLLQPRL